MVLNFKKVVSELNVSLNADYFFIFQSQTGEPSAEHIPDHLVAGIMCPIFDNSILWAYFLH